MLDDDKNEAYRDQVFYALAQIELEELNREEGMDYLRDALAEDSGNRRPRMKSFLALADLHLEDRSYELAQAYYDSTLANMDEDHPRYAEVRNNARSLTELGGAVDGDCAQRQPAGALQPGRGRAGLPGWRTSSRT